MATVGKLISIFGPMFSGKSSTMVSTVERYQFAQKACIIIKHSTDRRFGEANFVQTHARLIHDMVPVIYAKSFEDPEVGKAFSENDVIGIDEVQFFANGADSIKFMVDFLEKWLARGKIVVCAGLDTDWQRIPFSAVAPLIGRSHVVEKRLAVCMRCHSEDALFTARSRANDGDYADPVGGIDKYIALCRACYEHQAH